MEIPAAVSETVRAVLDANLSSMDAQLAKSIEAIRAREDFPVLVNFLVDFAVERVVGIERCRLNSAAKLEARRAVCRTPPGPPKVNVLDSPGVRRIAAESLYNLMVGGMCLGDMRRVDLLASAGRERAIARGHTRKARLLEWCLRRGVGDDSPLRAVISDADLRTAYVAILAGKPDHELPGESPPQSEK